MTKTVVTPVLHLMQQWSRYHNNLGECTPVGIAAHLDIGVNNAMALLDAAVNQGCIHKAADAHYGYVYTLTRKGMAA